MVNAQKSASAKKGRLLFVFIKAYMLVYAFYLAIKMTAALIYSIKDTKKLNGMFPGIAKTLSDFNELNQLLPVDAKRTILGRVIKNIEIELEDIVEYIAVNTDTELHELMNKFVHKLSRDV